MVSRPMLNDAKIKAAKPRETAYKLADSGQLFLHVSPAGGRHWRMNYTYGRSANDPKKPAQKTLTLGSYPAVSLVDARTERDKAKALLAAGRDPAVERRIADKAKEDESANTFRNVAKAWFDKKRPTWAKRHAEKVWASLEEDVFGEVGDLPIATIRAPKLLWLLTAVEERGAIETAHRIRQRISAVFVYAIAVGLADVDPAASLGKALSAKPRAQKQPSIIDGIRDQPGRITAFRQMMIDCEAERCRATTKLALRFLALTAVRPNELHSARWDELEGLGGKEPHWRIPAARMKGDSDRKAEAEGDHVVPLSRQALDVIAALRPLTGDLPLMFPSDRHVHKPMSENTLRTLLIRAGYYQRHVPHGFRAAFSTIMNERAKEIGRPDDRAVIDLMLAHVPKDKVESAYNRAAFLPRRRELAQEWADTILADMWPPEIHVGQPIRWAATGKGR
jgi:integrase